MSTSSFSQRLRTLRDQRKWSLEDMARAVGSTKSYVWDLENKPNVKPSAELVQRLAAALEVTIEELLTGAAPSDGEFRVFFREYQKLKPKTRERLHEIMKALKQTD